jgi:hypothetical protein
MGVHVESCSSLQSFILRRCLALVLCAAFAAVPGGSFPQLPSDAAPRLRTLAGDESPVGEAEVRKAIQRVEELAVSLQARAYREELREALRKLGYGEHDPVFRTSLNGFAQRQIDLDDADEFKRGAFAFSLRSAGQRLTPDPFDGWIKIQKQIDAFEPTMSGARATIARGGILAAEGPGNIPIDTFRKLSRRWRDAVSKATEAYEHALAIRAVEYSGGELTPAPQNFRFILNGGRYAAICASEVCSSPPARGPQ